MSYVENKLTSTCRHWQLDKICTEFVRKNSHRTSWNILVGYIQDKEEVCIEMADFIVAHIFDYMPDEYIAHNKLSVTLTVSHYSILIMSRMYPEPDNKWMYDIADRDVVFDWFNHLIEQNQAVRPRVRNDEIILRWLVDLARLVHDKETHILVIEPWGMAMEEIYVPIMVSRQAFRALIREVLNH